MEDLIILGAGGTSREIADAVADINSDRRRWNLIGFLDDDAAKHGKAVAGLSVLGSIDRAKQYPAAQFIIGMARADDPWRRKMIVVDGRVKTRPFSLMAGPSDP